MGGQLGGAGRFADEAFGVSRKVGVQDELAMREDVSGLAVALTGGASGVLRGSS